MISEEIIPKFVILKFLSDYYFSKLSYEKYCLFAKLNSTDEQGTPGRFHAKFGILHQCH